MSLDIAAASTLLMALRGQQVQWLIGLVCQILILMPQPTVKSLTTQSVTYASATAVSRENGGSGPLSKLRHAVAVVVYADQRAKERRENSRRIWLGSISS